VALTLAAWFRQEPAAAPAPDWRLVSKATSMDEGAHFWMLSSTTSGSSTVLRFRLRTAGRTDTLVADSGAIAPGVWTHAAAVYDGARMTLYKDGKKAGSIEKTGRLDQDPSVPAWIGANPVRPSDAPFAGLIDDVRIYARALTEAEIAALAK
jgi:hypothetical protein